MKKFKLLLCLLLSVALATLKEEFLTHEIDFTNIIAAKQNEISGTIEL